MRPTDAKYGVMFLLAIGMLAIVFALILGGPVAQANAGALNTLLLCLSNVFTALAVHRPADKPADPKS